MQPLSSYIQPSHSRASGFYSYDQPLVLTTPANLAFAYLGAFATRYGHDTSKVNQDLY